MRDEEKARHFMPALGRIVILLAVITAIPVVMWSTMAFVRTYLGPPEIPGARPMNASRVGPADQSATAPIEDPPQAGSSAQNGASQSATIGNITVAQPDTAVPSSAPSDVDPARISPAGTSAASGARPPALAGPAPGSAANRLPDQPMTTSVDSSPPTADPPGWPQVAAQQGPSADQAPMQQQTDWPAPPLASWPPPASAAAPAGAASATGPIAVPLPRKRPPPVAFAEATMPLPQPRPDAAGHGTPPAPAGPSDWLQGILQSSPSAAPERQEEHHGDY